MGRPVAGEMRGAAVLSSSTNPTGTFALGVELKVKVETDDVGGPMTYPDATPALADRQSTPPPMERSDRLREGMMVNGGGV